MSSLTPIDGGTVERKRSIRIPRALWLVVAIVVAVLVLAQDSTVLVPNLSFRLVDQRTIALTVGVAPYSWTRVTNVDETPTQVRITVRTLPWPIPGPGTAALALRELTVSLTDDLGSRTVTDAEGQAIPLRPADS